MIGLKGFLTRYQVQQNPLKTERRIELAAIFLLFLLLASMLAGGVGLVASQGPEPVLPSADSLAAQELKLDSGLTAEQAAEAYDKEAIKLRLPFSKLNYPKKAPVGYTPIQQPLQSSNTVGYRGVSKRSGKHIHWYIRDSKRSCHCLRSCCSQSQQIHHFIKLS